MKKLKVTNSTVHKTSTALSRKDALVLSSPLEVGITLGFNGYPLDKVSNCYILGNGYRLYNPILRTFYSADNLSPFGAAGINRYQYCSLNSVNLVDPSGHLSWQAGIGIGLGILGIALSVFTLGASISLIGAGGLLAGGLGLASGVLGLASASTGIASAALEESDPETSASLGWASLGLGIGSAVTGLAGASAARAMFSTPGMRALQISTAAARNPGGALSRSISRADVCWDSVAFVQREAGLISKAEYVRALRNVRAFKPGKYFSPAGARPIRSTSELLNVPQGSRMGFVGADGELKHAMLSMGGGRAAATKNNGFFLGRNGDAWDIINLPEQLTWNRAGMAHLQNQQSYHLYAAL